MKTLDINVNGVDYAITTGANVRGGGTYHASPKAPGTQGTSSRRLRRYLAKKARKEGAI